VVFFLLIFYAASLKPLVPEVPRLKLVPFLIQSLPGSASRSMHPSRMLSAVVLGDAAPRLAEMVVMDVVLLLALV